MTKKYLKIILFVGIILIVGTILVLFVKKNISKDKLDLSENYQDSTIESDVQVNVVSSALENISKGEYFEVEIYLKGNGISLVSGFETSLEFDSSQMEFVSATSAGFFEEPLEISLGENNLLASSVNPGVVKDGNFKNNVDLPVFICRFLAKEDILEKVSLDEQKTLVYLSKIGGYKPLVFYE